MDDLRLYKLQIKKGSGISNALTASVLRLFLKNSMDQPKMLSILSIALAVKVIIKFREIFTLFIVQTCFKEMLP